MELRASIMEITNGYQDGVWHKGDKPRFISHLMQIPLLLRDELLGTNQCDDERLLSDEDYEKCVKSPDPIRYCIQTWEAYLLTVDVPKKESGLEMMKKKHIPGGVVIFQLFNQCYNVGNIVSQLRFIKKCPVIRSYTNHQKLFTILWLILLPLGMTARTGFFTILWAPLISYGILALEFLATTLVDPLGDDELDIPVNKILTGMVERLIEAVRSTKWDYKHHIKESPVDSEARIGTCLDGMGIRDQYSLPSFTEDEVDASNFAEKPIANFNGPKKGMINVV